MESREWQIDPGATVEASDGRFGTVEEVIVRPRTGEPIYLVIRYGWNDRQLTIPADLIAAAPSRREVRLRVTREGAREAAARVTREPSDDLLASERGGALHFPVAEERLVPVKRPADLGELRIHKSVEEAEEAVREPVSRDELVVERVSVGRPLDAPLEPRVEGDWLVIPIMEEVLVVQKRLMLTEEIRIRKRQLTEEQEVRETVRRERVEFEDATVYGVEGLPTSDPTTRLPVDPRAPAAGSSPAVSHTGDAEASPETFTPPPPPPLRVPPPVRPPRPPSDEGS